MAPPEGKKIRRRSAGTATMDGGGGGHHRRPLFQPLLKKPVFVKSKEEDALDEAGSGCAVAGPPGGHGSSGAASSPSPSAPAGVSPALPGGEEEEALIALVELRSKDVERLRQHIEYYESQVLLSLLSRSHRKRR